MDGILASLSFAAFLIAYLFAAVAVPKIKFGDDQPPYGNAGSRGVARSRWKRQPSGKTLGSRRA